MKAEEIELIHSKHNAAIIAPAGHGKTEMITELVAAFPGTALVLTHTNAGVSALKQRFYKKDIPNDKYVLSTISSFCIRWCNAYPHISGIDKKLNYTDKKFYSDRQQGILNIFAHAWARNIITATYSCVIVDEYQDCTLEQHNIFLELNQSIPVYVLGDPLQAIFGWAGELVSWNNLGFEMVEFKTYPWRWDKTNKELGEYLANVRENLKHSLLNNRGKISTISRGNYIRQVFPANAHSPAFLSELAKFHTVLYLTKWPKEQCAFSRNSGGIFQNDEPQNLNDLYRFAQELDMNDRYESTKVIYSFIEECASNITTELGSYKAHIMSGDFLFEKIKKHTYFGSCIISLKQSCKYDDMLAILEYIQSKPEFHIHRKELFSEMIRAIHFAQSQNVTIYDAAQQIRMNPNYQNRYSNFKKLSSRTVLSKGLEFECVIIDLQNTQNTFSITDIYVAMTRATKMIYFITNKDEAELNVQ